MTKVWNETSWSDRDSVEESRERWKSRPSDPRVTVRKTFTYLLFLFLSVSTCLPRVADANEFLRYLLHSEWISLTCISIDDVCCIVAVYNSVFL